MNPLSFPRPDTLLPPFLQVRPNQNSLGINQRTQNRDFMYRAEPQRQNQPQPFFKNNQPHLMQNGKYQHHQNNQGSEKMNKMNSPSERDAYAGLMNSREKNWLNSIQLLQLNSNQPYIDDFYFTVFCDRLSKKKENNYARRTNDQGNGCHNNNNSNNRDSRYHFSNSDFFARNIVKFR